MPNHDNISKNFAIKRTLLASKLARNSYMRARMTLDESDRFVAQNELTFAISKFNDLILHAKNPNELTNMFYDLQKLRNDLITSLDWLINVSSILDMPSKSKEKKSTSE